MRFQLLDRIVEVVPGKKLVAVKNLTLGEEYLADHFPSFPVLPGVLMLEALVQSAAWLLRITDDFAHSLIVLREVKGVKYGNFVDPGKQLRLTVEQTKVEEGGRIGFKGNGEVNGVSSVNARFVLERSNLRDRDPGLADLDSRLIQQFRETYPTLRF
jgi:3-hydroxyacyl-[acyl-carrier-protein] dehydratase